MWGSHTITHMSVPDPAYALQRVVRKERECELQALVIVFTILVILAIVAGRYGVDSRDGFDRPT
jgi:hypothetical protein